MGNHDAHPQLSAAERDSLAGRIALMDGVTFPQARRQIEEFLGADWGGGVPEEEAPSAESTNEGLPWACAT